MVLQGLVVGDWPSVYKVVAITRLLVAPHHTQYTIHSSVVATTHHTLCTIHTIHTDDAGQLSDRGADQCNDSAPAFRSATLSPCAPLPSDATR